MGYPVPLCEDDLKNRSHTKQLTVWAPKASSHSRGHEHGQSLQDYVLASRWDLGGNLGWGPGSAGGSCWLSVGD